MNDIIFSLHTPEQLRELSNYAHWIEGAIFLTVALVLFLKTVGRMNAKKADLLWPGLIFGAGAFLIIYIFIHHPLGQMGLVWQVILEDPQQRQHMIMAVLLILVAGAQLLYSLKKITSPLWQYAWPIALFVVGLLFLFHPQHGTPEAIAYMKPYHTALGVVILSTGALVLAAIKHQQNKILQFSAIGLLTLSALILLFYREPAGAYQMNMQGMENGIMDNNTVSHGGPATDYVSFIDMLRSMGIVVTPNGEVNQEFFSLPGNSILVDGVQVQVFEFGTEEEAIRAAEDINPDGSGTKTMMITWIEPPHFYRKGKIIVLYLGTDAKMLSLLESALGKQFAGS